MTYGEVYHKGKSILAGAENESPSFDAACLMQKVFGLDRQALILRSAEAAADTQTAEYFRMVEERTAGRPLQYILGKWPFLGLELRVGEGVLIPREETELLVRTAADYLKDCVGPNVIDLCSGTGAVALGLASLLPGVRVTAVELYEEAFHYLVLNQQETGFQNVTPVRLDVLNPESAEQFSALDAIVSNPPYVKPEEIPALQIEVRREPRTALVGGADGLDFYRAIAQYWLPKLKRGGFAAVEVGEGQAPEVKRLFEAAGLSQIRFHTDFNGIERVVSGIYS